MFTSENIGFLLPVYMFDCVSVVHNMSKWATEIYMKSAPFFTCPFLLLLSLYACSCCCWVCFELVGSKDIFLIWIWIHLFILPFESLLSFPFHSALISFITFPRHTLLYLPFDIDNGSFHCRTTNCILLRNAKRLKTFTGVLRQRFKLAHAIATEDYLLTCPIKNVTIS